MKQLAMTWIGLTGLILLSTHSSVVYACDHAANASEVADATECKAVRTFVVTESSAAAESAPVMSFEIDVPGRTTPQYVRIVACEKSEPSSLALVRTARAAMTIGRALVTTFEAVMGSLLNAAAERTAFLV